eukprot:gb/GFBE01062962.1/.p1 GENE.gb/GFBE01062962.1/~~gb/GFBE01062962.1/.p1  ORF type:complete len:352 (+),score=57.75 gb/GFBE01062962.1/:1-1056(+)
MGLRGIAALFSLLAVACAVKVEPLFRHPSIVVDGFDESMNFAISRNGKPLPVNAFRNRIAEMPSDPGFNFSKTASFGEVKMLIGMLSTGRERQYRDMHRGSWMKSIGPKVCAVGTQTGSLPAGCNVFATFLLGNDGKTDAAMQREAKQLGDITFVKTDYGDLVVDPDTGNSNNWEIKVKVFHYFRQAVEHFPEVTHVIKTDIDAYPFPGNLAHIFVAAKGRNKDPEMSSMLFQAQATPPQGWSSEGGIRLGNQGQLYGYSASTLSCVFKALRADFSVNGTLVSPGDTQRKLIKGPAIPASGTPGEDGFFTEMVQHFATPNGKCRPTWNLRTTGGVLEGANFRDFKLWVDMN